MILLKDSLLLKIVYIKKGQEVFMIMKKNIGSKLALFEIPTYQYLKTGEVLGKCMSMEKEE